MFTGIIQAKGHIDHVEPSKTDSRFIFHAGRLDLTDINIGDSIAVNGVCLTVLEKDAHTFAADLSNESLTLTTFSMLKPGSAVNLEKALHLSDRVNGHIISGHVDGIGEIKDKQQDGRSVRYEILVPDDLQRYIAKKGSIAIDGVSLTVNNTCDHYVMLNIIPHTFNETLFSSYVIGAMVNIEVDLIARYLQKLMRCD